MKISFIVIETELASYKNINELIHASYFLGERRYAIFIQ